MSRKHKKGRITTIRSGEGPTKERRRQNGGVIKEIADRDYHDKVLVTRYKARWECPLDAYLDYGVIDEREHKVGIVFRAAYLSAHFNRRMEYEHLDKDTAHIDPIQSERLLKQAHKFLPSHPMGAVLDICGLDRTANNFTKLRNLKIGLGQLAALWRIASVEVCKRR